jgi:16S rRNA (guanine527-N7)-methyltransferase
MPTPSELLVQGVRRLGLGATEQQLARLEAFRVELERWNSTYGFVKASGRELVVRHFLDSLAGLPRIAALQPRRRVLDVGSGAGFPGLPLAIFLPDSFFTLLERSARKAAFLRTAAIRLELGNVSVEERQLVELHERFSVITFRAWSPLGRRELEELAARLEPGGVIAAYKGRRERIRAEAAAAGLREEDLAVEPLAVPFLREERHLVILRP